MSTRRTYVALSAAIAASAMQRPTAAQEVQRRFTASLIADALAKENRAFDVGRFLHDCGVSPEDMSRCQNCRWHGPTSALKPIKHYSERVAAGEEAPAGECPECGSLAHVVTP